MAFLSAALARIKPSPTVAITAHARRLKAEGRDIIGLSRRRARLRHARPTSAPRPRRRSTAARPATPRPRASPSCAAPSSPSSPARTGLDYAPDQVIVSTGGKQVLYNALVATIDPGDEVIVPAPYWVSYPDMVRLAGGTPVIVEGRIEHRLQDHPRGARRRDHPAHQVADPQLAVEPDRRRLLAATSSGRSPTCCSRHPHVWVMTDDIYEHIAYPPFVFATPAEVEPRLLRPHADRQRGLQGLRDDRLAHRLRRRAGAADPGDGHGAEPVDLQPLLDQPVGRGRGADRPAGLSSPRPRQPSAAAATWWSGG